MPLCEHTDSQFSITVDCYLRIEAHADEDKQTLELDSVRETAIDDNIAVIREIVSVLCDDCMEDITDQFSDEQLHEFLKQVIRRETLS